MVVTFQKKRRFLSAGGARYKTLSPPPDCLLRGRTAPIVKSRPAREPKKSSTSIPAHTSNRKFRFEMGSFATTADINAKSDIAQV